MKFDLYGDFQFGTISESSDAGIEPWACLTVSCLRTKSRGGNEGRERERERERKEMPPIILSPSGARWRSVLKSDSRFFFRRGALN